MRDTSNGEVAPWMCGCKSKKMGTSNWWLSSPNNYNGSNANEWNFNGSNGNIDNNNVNNSNAFRSSINLKKDVKFSGTGTSTDPYKIVTE